MSRLVFPRPSTQVPPIRFSAEAEREDVAGDRSGAAIVLMKSSGSWRVCSRTVACRSHRSRQQKNSGPTSDRIVNREVRHEVAVLHRSRSGPGAGLVPWSLPPHRLFCRGRAVCCQAVTDLACGSKRKIHKRLPNTCECRLGEERTERRKDCSPTYSRPSNRRTRFHQVPEPLGQCRVDIDRPLQKRVGGPASMTPWRNYTVSVYARD